MDNEYFFSENVEFLCKISLLTSQNGKENIILCLFYFDKKKIFRIVEFQDVFAYYGEKRQIFYIFLDTQKKKIFRISGLHDRI